MAQYQRVSPGIYKDTKTGKLIKSTTDPNKTTKPGGKTTKPGQKPGKPGVPQGQHTPIITSSNPLGGSEIKVDKDGNVTSEETFSPGNTGALNNLWGNAGGASSLVQGFMNSINSGQGTPQQTAALEEGLFRQLTGAGRSTGLDESFGRDREQLEQTLANRGIPLGSQLYTDQMRQLQDRYDVNKQSARDQATQQAWAQLTPLQNITQGGFIQPNQPDVGAIFSALQQAGLTEQQIAANLEIAKQGNKTNLQIAQMNNARRGGGGGGGGGGSEPQVFYNSGPPGAV